MKKIEFNNLPAGSVVLVKKHNLWDKVKAWITRKGLKYNYAWVDPFGGSGFSFQETFWTKYKVFAFVPKKPYSKKEMLKVFQIVLPMMLISDCPEEALLNVNLIRPNTFTGTTLEELLEGNKYYIKREIK